MNEAGGNYTADMLHRRCGDVSARRIEIDRQLKALAASPPDPRDADASRVWGRAFLALRRERERLAEVG